jgi:triacylglycerol esterase/lipase EstA (alpha/beta hydrolase family)
VYLVPGFFGFANLGDLKYFAHVREYLVGAFARRGLGAHVEVVRTRPTASLTRRAERVLSTMAETLQDDDGPVHLIGHSSGGLDVRLLLSPGVTLPTDLDVERYAGRVRTAVTVATPHHGTPLAAFFTSLLGQKLLQVLSLATISILRFGHLPLSALVQLGAVVARMDGLFGLNSALLDEIFAQLLADFSPERRRALAAFFSEVGGDQALLIQVTPEAMEVFNACTRARAGVRAGSVVTLGHPPSIASTLAVGLDPAAQATLAVYAALHRLARLPPDRVPLVEDAQADVLRTAFGTLPDAAANDGMVPTRSQPWGEVIAAVQADHLDVVGHFGDPAHDPPHIDWITTGSGCTTTRFEALWAAVVDFMLRAPASGIPVSRSAAS